MKAKIIGISFTLKGQSLQEITGVLESLSDHFGAKQGHCILAHGFMPRSVVAEKGFSMDLVNTLKSLFPHQIEFYKPDLTEMRKDMTDFFVANKVNVFTIGDVKEGVLEEYSLYTNNGVLVSQLRINFNNSWLPQPLTFGQMAVGITSNPSGMPEVNEIKEACANAIDVINNQRNKAKSENNGEKIAQFTIAIRDIQSGQMWGVKATTWQH